MDMWACHQSLQEQLTELPGVHADPAVLIDAWGGFSQDVDSVTGLLHVEQEVDWDSREGEDNQPDEGQDVRHYDELVKLREQCVRSQDVTQELKLHCDKVS